MKAYHGCTLGLLDILVCVENSLLSILNNHNTSIDSWLDVVAS